MINPAKLMKLKNALSVFSQNHPKFISYLNAVSKNALEEGNVIDINITTVDGKTLNSNIKLTKSDVEMFRELSELSGNI